MSPVSELVQVMVELRLWWGSSSILSSFASPININLILTLSGLQEDALHGHNLFSNLFLIFLLNNKSSYKVQ